MSTGPIAVRYSRRISAQPVAETARLLGEQRLQVRLDAVLDQAGVDAELVRGVVVDGRDRDDQLLAGPVGDGPGAGAGVVDDSHGEHGGLIQFSGL